MFEMLDHNGPGHFGSSFALGFSEPNFVEKPTHPHQGRGSWRMRSQTSSRRTWPSCTTQAALGASGYVTVEDLADRWDTPAAARENGPRDLDPRMGFCPDLGLHGDAPPSGSPGGCPAGGCFVAIHGTPKPRLEFQGSDGYLKKQWRLIAKGELGDIPAKHIVSTPGRRGTPLIHP